VKNTQWQTIHIKLFRLKTKEKKTVHDVCSGKKTYSILPY